MKTEDGKQPFFIRLRDEAPFAFAGLYGWDRPSGFLYAPGVFPRDKVDCPTTTVGHGRINRETVGAASSCAPLRECTKPC